MITRTRRQAKRIAAGTQTVTTALDGKGWRLGGVHQVRAGRHGPVTCYVQIVGKGPLLLGQYTDEDARNEGYTDLADMRRHWRQLGFGWDPQKLVYRLRLAKVPDPERYRQLSFTEEVTS